MSSNIKVNQLETLELVVKKELNEETPVAAITPKVKVEPLATPERVAKMEHDQVTLAATKIEPCESDERVADQLAKVATVETPDKLLTLENVLNGKKAIQETKSKNKQKEDGEVSDSESSVSEKRWSPRPICRFFASNSCRWGSHCRFIHPKANMGNYHMFERVEPQPKVWFNEQSAEFVTSFSTSLAEVRHMMVEAGYNVNKPRQRYTHKPWVEFNDLDTDPYYTHSFEMQVDRSSELANNNKPSLSQGGKVKVKSEIANLTYSSDSSSSSDDYTSTTSSSSSSLWSIPRRFRTYQTSHYYDRRSFTKKDNKQTPSWSPYSSSSSSSSDTSSYTSSTQSSEQSSSYRRYYTKCYKTIKSRNRSLLTTRKQGYMKRSYRSRSRSPLERKQRKDAKRYHSTKKDTRRKRY